MAWKTVNELSEDKSTIKGFIYDDKNPDEKKLIYVIHRNLLKIEFYPRSRFIFFEKIILHGYTSLPDFLNANGKSKNHLLDYLARNFTGKNVESVEVLRGGKAAIIRNGTKITVQIPSTTLLKLTDQIGSVTAANNKHRAGVVRQILHDDFPELIVIKESSKSKVDLKLALQTLQLFDQTSFEKEDIYQLTDLLTSLMKTSFKSQITKSTLFKTTKIKVDTVTLDEIIIKFDEMLKKGVDEAEWGKFLESNLFLIDSKYIHSIPQLNLVLAGARKVDFGLVDVYGYLDIFEIKKPETKLLSSEVDRRGNYVWHKEAMEAIVQAEKYHFNIESKRATLQVDIARERNIKLDVIRPRGLLVMGSSEQLDSQAKKDDFRILSNQFKNLQIILYDELLLRIKNQRQSLQSNTLTDN